MKTLIQGGTVVTATEVFCGDVLTDGEQVKAVGLDLAGEVVDLDLAQGRRGACGGEEERKGEAYEGVHAPSIGGRGKILGIG